MADFFEEREQADADQKKANEILREQQEDELYFMRQVLSTYEGRAVLYRLLDMSKTFSRLTVGETVDMVSDITISNYGKDLLAEVMTADPSAFNTMQTEAYERKIKREGT